jgi:hypothetical protein
MRFPGDDRRKGTGSFVAAEDASRLAGEAGLVIDRAVGIEWYEQPGSDIDLAALTLCRLRRARAGESGGPQHGDEAVRIALGGASTPAIVWLASRAISYMDESGFPEALAPWLPDEEIVDA